MLLWLSSYSATLVYPNKKVEVEGANVKLRLTQKENGVFLHVPPGALHSKTLEDQESRRFSAALQELTFLSENY